MELSNLKEHWSFRKALQITGEERGRHFVNNEQQHYSSQQSISLLLFFFWPSLALSFALFLWAHWGVTHPWPIETLTMSASHLARTHSPSSCSVLGCRSQSPVTQILINWLLVDVIVTHLQMVPNLCITPGLVRPTVQWECFHILGNAGSSLYSPRHDEN